MGSPRSDEDRSASTQEPDDGPGVGFGDGLLQGAMQLGPLLVVEVVATAGEHIVERYELARKRASA